MRPRQSFCAPYRHLAWHRGHSVYGESVSATFRRHDNHFLQAPRRLHAVMAYRFLQMRRAREMKSPAFSGVRATEVRIAIESRATRQMQSADTRRMRRQRPPVARRRAEWPIRREPTRHMRASPHALHQTRRRQPLVAGSTAPERHFSRTLPVICFTIFRVICCLRRKAARINLG